MKQKINRRLFLIALIAVVASTIAITFVYYELFSRQVRQDLKIHAELLEAAGIFENSTVNSDELVKLNRLKNKNLRITWLDSDGTVLFDNDTADAELDNHKDRPEVTEAIANGEGESVRKSKTFKLATFYYAKKLNNKTVLRVAMQARSVSSLFITAAPVIFLIIIAVLAICIVIGRMLTKTILEPIEQMAENLNDHGRTTVIYSELKPFADKIRAQHEHILASAESRQDFTANVTHELKTPLTAISGYAELIENHMIDADQETHIAQQIRHNADRLLYMINDIIRLSELDHKELPRNFENVDLNETAKECCDNLKVAADHANISLSYKGTDSFISADKALIRELIENLVQNAIRYNHEDGHVWVEVNNENGHPTLIVKDDGIGIPKEKQARVFERFYRVDKGRSRDMGGTGLGLAIVKHIAEIHNAEITLNSILGKGTDIEVVF